MVNIKKKKIINFGKVNISCFVNNTFLSLKDKDDKLLLNISCGNLGYKGSKRSTYFAIQKTAEFFGRKIKDLGYNLLFISFKGFGFGRVAAIKGLKKKNLNFKVLVDSTPVPHNGCRPKKRRRV